MGGRCAYLTMEEIGNFVADSDLSIAPMAELGWEVEMLPWRRDVDWNDYDLVYICTPWDYQHDVEAFLGVLEAIERSSARLVNSLDLVRWNLEKTYLRELEMRGADIVPSIFFDRFDAHRIAACFSAHDTGMIVVKPVVGANSDHIFVLTEPLPGDAVEELEQTFERRPFFVQPFIDSVQSEGEYSLFFFGGEVIGGFSIALIWGVVIGTYSSIALAVPVLLYLDIDRGTGEESANASLEAAG